MMNPRKITIDGINVEIPSCQCCPCFGQNDETGDEWCQYPGINSCSIDESDFPEKEMARQFGVFPNFCPLKEV